MRKLRRIDNIIQYYRTRQSRVRMFFDTLLTMLQKENLSEYLFAKINILKINPAQRLDSYLVQVASPDQITDGQTNFQAKFKKQLKKGSIIRLIQWKLDFKSFQIIIDDCQYLGGAGYGVKSGKAWDVQKLKLITNSSIISKDFVVLHNPILPLQDSASSSNLSKPPSTPIFRLNVAKSKYFEEKACRQKAIIRKSQGLSQNGKKNNCKPKQESQSVGKSLQVVEDAESLQAESIHNSDKVFKYSQIDIENVRKLKLIEQIDNKTLSNLSIRDLAARRIEIIQKKIEGARSESGVKCDEENGLITAEKGMVNEDSKGRQLVFNKEEIKKLLGKQ